jgi:predicted phage terminase large subunit-like protein
MRATESSQADCDIALREAAMDSLCTFSEIFGGPNYRAAKIHRFLARQLELCASRKIRRLVISCPPRHGKTLLTSVLFPAWALTKNPALNIMTASYGAELSEKFSRQTRAVLASEAYREIFPPVLDPNEARARSWRTLAGGGLYSTGVGGGATGRGADIFLLDDPTKNRDEANSEAHRESLWSWFLATAMTRLSPHGVMIVISTRWSEDDLIGRLTHPDRVRQFQDAGLGSESFHVVKLEAICESPETDPLGRMMGEALWPEQWPVERLEAARIAIGSREFQAQYQSRPNLPGGNLCDVSKIRMIDRHEVPEGLRLLRGWDLALTTKALSDYSCGAYAGRDKHGNVYLLNMHRGKRSWCDQKQVIIQHALAEADGDRIGLESVGAFAIAHAELREALSGRVRVEPYLTGGRDKAARAQPWFSVVDAGKFHMVRGPWNQAFKSEIENFPNGIHDDQIDAMSVCWDMIRPRQVLCVA